MDVIVVMPATGNTIAKFANVVDTPALMAMKASSGTSVSNCAISTNVAWG